MVSASALTTPFSGFSTASSFGTRVAGVQLSHYASTCFKAYEKIMGQGEGAFNFSPNILERKFREGIEVSCKRDEDGWEEWVFAKATVTAMIDALEQVRDVVGQVCGTQEGLGDYSAWSSLYSRFRGTGLNYPFEPRHAFDLDWWYSTFNSFREMEEGVIQVQIWAMGMLWALRSLAVYEGVPPGTVSRILPPVSCAHWNAAQAARAAEQEEEERRLERIREEGDELLSNCYSDESNTSTSEEEDSYKYGLSSPPSSF